MVPISYGFFQWNSFAAQISSGKEITFDDVHKSLLMDAIPPKLRDIDETKALLCQRKLPDEIDDYPEQKVLCMERPFAYTPAVNLFVAKQRGCNLDKIDFMFSGSILGILQKRKIPFDPTEDIEIMVQMKKGIIIIRKLARKPRNQNAAGFKFEKIISEEEYSEESNLSGINHVREILLGNHRILICAEIDLIDDSKNPIEAKFLTKKRETNELEIHRRILFQMLSNGSTEVVIGTKTINQQKNSYQIANIQKHSLEDIWNIVRQKTSEEELFGPIIEGLNELKQNVECGSIKAGPNYFYKLVFVDGKMVFEHLGMSMRGTVEYRSQPLYEALL